MHGTAKLQVIEMLRCPYDPAMIPNYGLMAIRKDAPGVKAGLKIGVVFALHRIRVPQRVVRLQRR
jgi:hypothetical protein